MKAIRRQLRAAALGALAVIISSVPLSAQRNRPGRQARPARAVEVGVAVRTDFGAFAVTNRGVAFRSRGTRRRLVLRGLEIQNPRAFRRLMRDHRKMHRDLRRMRRGRAARRHARWHQLVGFTHRDFERREGRDHRRSRAW